MIYNEIDALIATAMKEGNVDELKVLRMIKTSLVNEEKSGKTIDEATEMKVLMKMATTRKESIEIYEKSGRKELADEERKELQYIREWLPEEVSPNAIKRAVNEAIDKIVEEKGKVQMSDIGNIMKFVKTKYPTADGKLISSCVKERTS